MSASKSSCTGIGPAFLSAAARYWLGVFPFVCHEIHRWEQRARTIPDPKLRELALKALLEERGNLEGAAAYAAFVPRPWRTALVRAAIAFQATYDYADAISEQPDRGRAGSVHRLHQALLIALNPDATNLDYHEQRDDGGYLNCLVDRCRTAVGFLPNFPRVAQQLQRAATRIVTYQELNHRCPGSSHRAFAAWASRQTPVESDLRWWETGAAAGSSLLVFALMSAAAQPVLEVDHIAALESAYFPWICSLHTLLDSLIDEREDDLTGQHSLTARYLSREEMASRLQALAARAVSRASALPQADCHTTIVGAMVGFYLSNPQARDPHARLATQRVLQTLGNRAIPAILVLRARHSVSRVVKQRRRLPAAGQ